VTYGSGSFSGTEFTDTVTLAPGLVIQHQSIGVASTVSTMLWPLPERRSANNPFQSTGFASVDGILGYEFPNQFIELLIQPSFD